MDDFEKVVELGVDPIESVPGPAVEILMEYFQPAPEEREWVKLLLRKVIRDAVRIAIAIERRRLIASKN